MGSHDVFDDFANAGREFLAISKSQQTLKNYSWQLGTILDLIKHTHSIIVGKLEAVDECTTIEEAKSLVGELEGGPLTDSFRANHLCDIFQGMGMALNQLTSSLGSQESKWRWDQFCSALQERENSVAQLYASQLRDMIDLKYKSNNQQDLDSLKAAAKDTIRKLTVQMADFDGLAAQFRAL